LRGGGGNGKRKGGGRRERNDERRGEGMVQVRSGGAVGKRMRRNHGTTGGEKKGG